MREKEIWIQIQFLVLSIEGRLHETLRILTCRFDFGSSSYSNHNNNVYGPDKILYSNNYYWSN